MTSAAQLGQLNAIGVPQSRQKRPGDASISPQLGHVAATLTSPDGRGTPGVSGANHALFGDADEVNVLRLCWLGVPTTQYDMMIGLFRDVMGLPVDFAESTTTEMALPSGDRVQVFAPDHPYFEFYREHASGPVALFEVDDVHVARAELDRAGIEVLGEIERESRWDWLHFRAPDGNLYGLTSTRSTTP